MLPEKNELIELLRNIFPFNKADDDLLGLTADCFQIIEVNEDELIYNQAEKASDLYIVFSGEVQLSQFNNSDSRIVGVLKRGDWFGFEMLEYERLNLTAAESLSDCVLLKLDRKHAKVLLTEVPDLNPALEILFESYLLNLERTFPWLNEDEMIYFIARKHRMYMFLRIMIPIMFAGFTIPLVGIAAFEFLQDILTPILILSGVFLIAVLWLIWAVIDWRNDYALITSQRVVYLEKVVMLYDSRQEAPLNAILSVNTRSSQVGRIIGYGDVVIRTYAGEIILPKVKNFVQVSNLMTAQWLQSKTRHTQLQKDSIEDQLLEKLGLIEEPEELSKTTTDEVPREVKSSSILNKLSTMFQLRVAAGQSITFRTHWFMLLKRTWLPVFLMIGLIIALIGRLSGWFDLLTLNALCGLEAILSLVFVGWWIYEYLDWRNDAYIITPEQVIDINRKPLGKEEKRAAPLKNVLSIEFERLGILGLILNFGTVSIRVGEDILTFDYVFNPAEVQRELFKKLAEMDQREKQKQINATQEQVADWIAAYDKLKRDDST